MSNQYKYMELDVDIDPLEIKGDKVNGQYFDMKVSGAYKFGTKIIKVCTQEGDANFNGSTGIVLGSVINHENEIGYFVRWDSSPEKNVFVCDFKIMELKN